ncbi:MAG: phytanoyl-CoA dioxygenase family protein [Chloroflexi bacterium]|nr:phytanoyl-CoA dioxygenase family protein [Chloroflexota bacterium]
MLTQEQIDFFHENGYLRIPQVFDEAEVAELSDSLDRLIEDWSITSPGWSGPWRDVYLDAEVEKQVKLTAMHDLHLYSDAWMRAVTNPKLAKCLSQLLDSSVELHHTTMHIKPPQTGHPFPMHQDSPFYEHSDGRFLDTLVHLDDTFHENGEIRFLARSHKMGKLSHILEYPDGTKCAPHLNTDEFKLEDTVPVPAKRGDVVVFHIYCIHGSYINQTQEPRRMVRMGFRDPHNDQLAGQSKGRPGLIVHGYRERRGAEELLKQT